jgi:predicted amidophosphoribosyltransferase
VSPIAIYVSVLCVVLLVCVGAMVFNQPPVRSCPQCERRVRQDARICRRCGYRLVKPI